jgi:hypothetical protein
MHLRKVLRQFFGMPKILLPEPEKLHRRSYDGLRCSHEWPDGFPIRAEFEHFLYRVSIWCQFRDSVTSTFPLPCVHLVSISGQLVTYKIRCLYF